MADPHKIRFQCSNCKKSFSASVQHAGKRGKCSRCGVLIQVPVTEHVEAGPRPSSESQAIDFPVGPLLSLHEYKGGVNGVNTLAISPAGQTAISALKDIRLWDLATGKELLNIDCKEHIFRVEFTKDGSCAVSGSGVGAIHLWDLTTGRKLRSFEGHRDGDSTSDRDSVSCLTFSPDGRSFLSAVGETLHLWDFATGQRLLYFEGHQSSPTAAAFSDDGRHVISASKFDRTVRIWDMTTCQEIRRFEIIVNGLWSRVVLTPDGRFACCGGGNSVRVYDVATGQKYCHLKGHTEEVGQVDILPDASLALSVSFDKTIRLWECTKSRELHRFEIDSFHGYARLAMCPSGRRFLFGWDKVQLWGLPVVDVRSEFARESKESASQPGSAQSAQEWRDLAAAAVDGPETAAKEEAVQLLIEAGPEAADAVLERFKQCPSDYRLAGILTRIGDERAVEPLVASFPEFSYLITPNVQRHVVEFFARIGASQAADGLVKYLHLHSNNSTRREAARGLGLLAVEGTRSLLRAEVEKGNSEVIDGLKYAATEFALSILREGQDRRPRTSSDSSGVFAYVFPSGIDQVQADQELLPELQQFNSSRRPGEFRVGTRVFGLPSGFPKFSILVYTKPPGEAIPQDLAKRLARIMEKHGGRPITKPRSSADEEPRKPKEDQASLSCGHSGSEYVCRRCRTAFCYGCLEGHAKRIGELSADIAAQMLGSRLVGTVRTFDGHDLAWCPRCVTEFSQMQSVGRTIHR